MPGDTLLLKSQPNYPSLIMNRYLPKLKFETKVERSKEKVNLPEDLALCRGSRIRLQRVTSDLHQFNIIVGLAGDLVGKDVYFVFS